MFAEKLNWEEFEKHKDKTALLVFGALEPHGKHLPLEIDSYIPTKMAERLGEREDVVVFPTVPFGYVYTLRKYPGAISLTSRTLYNIVKDIVKELLRSGFRKFLILSGHGGNTSIIKSALKELKGDFRANVIEWWRLTEAEAGHADRVESALYLALGGKLKETPVQEERKDYLGVVIPTPEKLFTPSGYIGNVENISKEEGEKILKEIEEKIIRIIENNLIVEV
ncbi:creatininase family protein [Candidatus Micrarchaeota archaeon]|nr:creatininase family protein [Candidatus Micrarchaeota archaeon]